MTLPYWLSDSLLPLPGLLLVYVGLGVPWALVVLPRSAWSSRAGVAALAFAGGPLLLTLWMLPLGMAGALQLEPVAGGAIVMLVAGWLLAWRKGRQPAADSAAPPPLTGLEKLLLALIALALLPRLYSIAWWPFTAYDALWVYGHQARLYTLTGAIPATIGYYPQYLPLQFTFAQLLAGGVNDHAARAVLFFTHAGCALATYLAGARLFRRRVGIIAAAIWVLYPHSGEWVRFGDLEIVLTMLFTLAATFFLLAWTGERQRRRHALIAGLLLGAALWTKPTAGAFILGVALMLAVDLWRVRGDWHAFRPRFEVALLTGLACLPHGSIWYLRNLALAHNVVEFPDSIWLERAARSGAEFGWPLLALLCLLLACGRAAFFPRSRARHVVTGLALVAAALLPTMIGQWQVPQLESLFPRRRLQVIEWAALAAGALLLWRSFRPLLPASGSRRSIALNAWALTLALPWFVTWLWSYSYHYRLSFAIVPLLILPCAAALDHWLSRVRPHRWSIHRRTPASLLLCLAALPGIAGALIDPAIGSDWLQPGRYPNDEMRYGSGNQALLWLVNELKQQQELQPERALAVAAPGVRRLPFFFPLADIRVTDNPTRLQELRELDFYVDGIPENPLRWDERSPGRNQVQGALALAGSSTDNVVRRIGSRDDGIFSYTLYSLNHGLRFQEPANAHDPAQPVAFGNLARYRGHDLEAATLWPGREVIVTLYWEVLNVAERDLSIFVHLRDADGNLLANRDGPVGLDEARRFYSTLLWEPGEFIRDERVLRVPEDLEAGLAPGPELWIGIYDWRSGERLPVAVDGRPAGDSYRLAEEITLLAREPD